MVDFKSLSTAIVLPFALAALGSPVPREENSFLMHLITRKSSYSFSNILAKDNAWIANFNGDAAAAVDSGVATNEDDTYVAAFSLTVVTGSSNTRASHSLTDLALSSGQSTLAVVRAIYMWTSALARLTGVTVAALSIDVATTSSGFTSVDVTIDFGPVNLTENTVTDVIKALTLLNSLKSWGSITLEVLGIYYAPEYCSDDGDANGELTLSRPTSKFSFTIGEAVFSLTLAEYSIPTSQYGVWGLTGLDYCSWIYDGGSSGVDFIIDQKFIEKYYTVIDTT
ncbi:hypothetical protein FIBSPDRAFT_1045193 [Athelia psychrophila]|uniref:Uncharacterized protein n=1 Tax=Athelia psychrophila TaxID=1759441 RepID=A0A166ILS0_9AGAM|nr:hypothetical protein FIBSPDRAFT_1045193 [Fibularhizoctonia sp. CBS 109695]